MTRRLKQQAVGELVRRLREQRGLSLRALASATEFSPSFLSQLENGAASSSANGIARRKVRAKSSRLASASSIRTR